MGIHKLKLWKDILCDIFSDKVLVMVHYMNVGKYVVLL